jgi:hypothetical protein
LLAAIGCLALAISTFANFERQEIKKRVAKIALALSSGLAVIVTLLGIQLYVIAILFCDDPGAVCSSMGHALWVLGYSLLLPFVAVGWGPFCLSMIFFRYERFRSSIVAAGMLPLFILTYLAYKMVTGEGVLAAWARLHS